jgi:hypothetical protein
MVEILRYAQDDDDGISYHHHIKNTEAWREGGELFNNTTLNYETSQ